MNPTQTMNYRLDVFQNGALLQSAVMPSEDIGRKYARQFRAMGNYDCRLYYMAGLKPRAIDLNS